MYLENSFFLCFPSLCSFHLYLYFFVFVFINGCQCMGAFDTLDNAIKGLYSHLFCRIGFIPGFSGSYIHYHTQKRRDQRVFVKSYMNFCINKIQFQRMYFFTFAKTGTCSPEHIAHSYFVVGGKTKREKQCYLHSFDWWGKLLLVGAEKGKSLVF